MTHKSSSKIFLTFIICLMPFSTYASPTPEFNEETLYKDFLTVMEKATSQAFASGTMIFGATCFANFFIMLINTETKDGENLDYISILSATTAAVLLGGLCGFNKGYSEILEQIS